MKRVTIAAAAITLFGLSGFAQAGHQQNDALNLTALSHAVTTSLTASPNADIQLAGDCYYGRSYRRSYAPSYYPAPVYHRSYSYPPYGRRSYYRGYGGYGHHHHYGGHRRSGIGLYIGF